MSDVLSGSPRKILVVNRAFAETVSPHCFPDDLAASFSEAIRAIANNKSRKKLTRQLDLNLKYDWITERLLDGPDFGLQFWKKFPGVDGYLYVSSVGFNSDKTKAVVSVYFWCGMLCAERNSLLLEKRNRRWHVIPTPVCGGVS
jgi:hypothetical protein